MIFQGLNNNRFYHTTDGKTMEQYSPLHSFASKHSTSCNTLPVPILPLRYPMGKADLHKSLANSLQPKQGTKHGNLSNHITVLNLRDNGWLGYVRALTERTMHLKIPTLSKRLQQRLGGDQKLPFPKQSVTSKYLLPLHLTRMRTA